MIKKILNPLLMLLLALSLFVAMWLFGASGFLLLPRPLSS